MTVTRWEFSRYGRTCFACDKPIARHSPRIEEDAPSPPLVHRRAWHLSCYDGRQGPPRIAMVRLPVPQEERGGGVEVGSGVVGDAGDAHYTRDARGPSPSGPPSRAPEVP